MARSFRKGEEKGWSEAVKGLLTVEHWHIKACKRKSIQRIVTLVHLR